MNRIRSAATVLAACVLVLGPGVAPTSADDGDTGTDDYRMQLVLDASGSMKEPADGGRKIDIAKQALDSVVTDLPESARVGLRVYGATISSGKGACTDTQQVVAPETGNRDALHDAIDDYSPLGETPIGYSLQQAAKDLGSEGKRTIVLVSDGESTCAPEPCEVAKQLSEDGIDLRIDVVGLSVDTKTRKQLQCIADAGNGTYYDADDAESLTESIHTVSTRAFRPFDLTGEPIEGSTAKKGAPTIEADQQYLDRLPTDGKKYYRIERTVPGSTIHVGTTARTPSGSSGSAVYMELNKGGLTGLCASGTSFATGIGADRPLLSGSIGSDDPTSDGECAKPDALTFSVENTASDLANRPFEIVAYEEPPLVKGAEQDLPPESAAPTWTKLKPRNAEKDIVPGTSLANAPKIDDGTYSLDIQSGETQVFAVPVDWGQRLQVQLDTTMPEKAYGNAGIYSGFEPVIYGPTRAKSSVSMFGEVPSDWTETPLGNLGFEDDKGWRIGAMTPEVRYRNRFASDSDRRGASVAGYRFVEVDFSVMKDGVTIPYDLTVKRFGHAGKGAPDYADTDDLTEPAADGSGAPVAEGAAPSDDANLASGTDSDDGAPVLAMALGGAGVLLLLGGVVAVAIARRPRTG